METISDPRCGTCASCVCVESESIVAIRYTLRQAADAIRANETELAENMIHRALEELAKYTGD